MKLILNLHVFNSIYYTIKNFLAQRKLATYLPMYKKFHKFFKWNKKYEVICGTTGFGLMIFHCIHNIRYRPNQLLHRIFTVLLVTGEHRHLEKQWRFHNSNFACSTLITEIQICSVALRNLLSLRRVI